VTTASSLRNSSVRWSVMIPTFNSDEFLAESLASVLAQDPGEDEMEIEVIDDCSTVGDPKAVALRTGTGRVGFFRQPANVGASANFNTCIQRATGSFVHILHADDRVESGFYDRIGSALTRFPSLGAAFCRSRIIDELGRERGHSYLEAEHAGVLPNYVERLSTMNRVMMSTLVARRSVYLELGSFRLDLVHAADWEMWCRIATRFPLWFEPQPLASYRRHSRSDTARLKRTGRNVADARRAIAITSTYWPRESAERWSEAAYDRHAFFALESARRLLALGDGKAALAQVREGLACARTSASLREGVAVLRRVQHRRGSSTLDQRAALDTSRDARRRVADRWLLIPTDEVEREYLGDLGTAQRLLLESGLRDVGRTGSEQRFVRALARRMSEPLSAGDRVACGLAAQLYVSPIRSASVLPEATDAIAGEEPPTMRLADADVRTSTRVALVFDRDPPWVGSDHGLLLALARRLRERGVAPLVLAPPTARRPFLREGFLLTELERLGDYDAVVTRSAGDWTSSAGRFLRRLDRRPAWLHLPCGDRVDAWLLDAADRVGALGLPDVRLATRVCGDASKVVELAAGAAVQADVAQPPFRRRRAIRGGHIAAVGGGPAELERLVIRFRLLRARHAVVPLSLVLLPPLGRRVHMPDDPDVVVADPSRRSRTIDECLFVACPSREFVDPDVGVSRGPLEALAHGKAFVAEASVPLGRELASGGRLVRTDAQWLDAADALAFDPPTRRSLEAHVARSLRAKFEYERMMRDLESAVVAVLSDRAEAAPAAAGAPPRCG
jgi:glycosyltransferase involved in cell wall biosynthesis